ncbi:nucleotide-binding oligomerization domain-containing protein 1-like, partial [Dendronephthya gigantea]|uniref:nucleotide-binding oligomerization domain-containing protein 1-like n=1 Tax=Dendronephthya gigantea TaxID=151771 RepID=UPI00106B80CE
MNFTWIQDAVPAWLAPRKFSYVAYVCIFLHIAAGVAIASATAALRESETQKFDCFYDVETLKTSKTQVERSCFLKYDKVYNSPLPLYQFVSLSFGFTAAITFVYLLTVKRRVDEIESNFKKQTDQEDVNEDHKRKTAYVFYFYLVHLVVRSILGIVFTVLQHAYFYPNGSQSNFNCVLSPEEINAPMVKSRYHFIQCENSTSFEKWIWSVLVTAINITFAVILLAEAVLLCSTRRISRSVTGDTEFVINYFLRSEYKPPLTSDECVTSYKNDVLTKNDSLGRWYADVLIQRVPPCSKPLNKITDLLFRSDEEDKTGKTPLKILAIGCPGLGKTSLAKQVIADWANGTDEYYRDKIAFFFQFKHFNDENLGNLNEKQFLQFGTEVQETRDFKSIYDAVVEQPSKALFVFDGLDEYGGDADSCFTNFETTKYQRNMPISGMVFFLKLVLGSIFKGATIFVTSRSSAAPTFFKDINFDRKVEIIGMTSEQIKNYVNTLCEKEGRNDFKSLVWNYINSSSHVLNLCRIPVNCYIVCITLFQETENRSL